MKRVARIQKECPICGKTFETTESLIKLGAGKYCSAPCRAIGAGRKTSETRMKNPKRIKKICETCGKEFSVYPSWAYRKNCSRECAMVKRVICKCLECGKEFEVPITEQRKFCSKKCAWASNSKLTGENARHWQGGKIKRVCKQCGKEFAVFKSKIDVGEGNFCSRKCSAIHNQPKGETNPNYNRVAVNCGYCGKEILAKLHQLKNKNGNFCSKRCYYNWASENLRGETSPSFASKTFSCIICQKKFTLPKHLEDKGRTKYCSLECYWKDLPNLYCGSNHPSWVGGPKNYCEKWTMEFKRRIRAWYNFECVECGTRQNGKLFHCHHVYYDKKACCAVSEEGAYFSNLGVEGAPFDFEIVGDPNKFVLLCDKCHARSTPKKNRAYWARHFEEMVNSYYQGRSYLTKEEYAALYP